MPKKRVEFKGPELGLKIMVKADCSVGLLLPWKSSIHLDNVTWVFNGSALWPSCEVKNLQGTSGAGKDLQYQAEYQEALKMGVSPSHPVSGQGTWEGTEGGSPTQPYIASMWDTRMWSHMCGLNGALLLKISDQKHMGVPVHMKRSTPSDTTLRNS